MKKATLGEFKNGWFIGKFDPTLCATDYFEVAVKTYKSGDVDAAHYHKIAVEYTMVVVGEIEMNGEIFKENEIIVVEPKEVVKFKSITDSKILVVKMPSVINDKFVV